MRTPPGSPSRRPTTTPGRPPQQRDLALDALNTLVTKVNERLKFRPNMYALNQELLNAALQGLERQWRGVPRTRRRSTST